MAPNTRKERGTTRRAYISHLIALAGACLAAPSLALVVCEGVAEHQEVGKASSAPALRVAQCPRWGANCPRRAPPLTQSAGGGASVSKSSSSSQSAQLVTDIWVCFQRFSSISGTFSASFFLDLQPEPEACSGVGWEISHAAGSLAAETAK